MITHTLYNHRGKTIVVCKKHCCVHDGLELDFTDIKNYIKGVESKIE